MQCIELVEMSRKGNCWENAVAGPCSKSLKVEWVYKHDYGPRLEAELSIFQWVYSVMPYIL